MTSPEPKQPLLTRGVQAVLAFTLTYLAAAVIGALTTGNAEFIIYIGIMASSTIKSSTPLDSA